jgi:hypothetical protein
MHFFSTEIISNERNLVTLAGNKILQLNSVSQLNFNYSNFYFLNTRNLQLFGNSSFAVENTNFFLFYFNKQFFEIETEQYMPFAKETFYDEEFIFHNYLKLRNYSFITFFIDNMIDVPICFKKSKSLKTKNFESVFLKFSNLIMRAGKKEKFFRIFLSSFFSFFNELKKKPLSDQTSVLN